MNSQQQQYRRRTQQNQASADIHLSEIPEVDVLSEEFPDKPQYFKYAFANPYNLTLLGGALVASALTFNPLIAVAAVGVEGLWLLHGSTSGFMKRWLWDPIYENEKNEFLQKQRLKAVESLNGNARERVRQLLEKEQQIKNLAAQNPSFTGDLLRNELVKTSNLVNSYIDLAVNSSRYERYLNTVNIVDLQSQRSKYLSFIEQTKSGKVDAAEMNLLKRNLAVVEKRIERIDEIQRYLKLAYGQVSLIENSFQLIAEQIMTMQSPNELSSQLNDLLDGVESIQKTSQNDEILKTL